MKTLIIYDNTGSLIASRSGSPEPKEPVGVPFLWVDIPEGKQLKITDGIGVDVSVAPHQTILENIPKSDIQILKERQDATENALLDLLLGGM